MTMRFHRADNIVFCSNDDRDVDYIRAVAQLVYGAYDGQADRWQLTDSERMWQMSFGGRAGVVGVKLNGRVSCAKLFYDARLRTKLRAAAGFSKSRRAYRHGVRLGEANVRCPRMLGYAERRPTGPGMLVTELIDDGIRLDHWTQEHGAPRQAVEALARFIRDMHDHGVAHVDLSPRNILIRPRDEHFEFFLLDYEDARFARRIRRHTRLNNLHHLHERMIAYVPVRERLRFLRTYASDGYVAYRAALGRMIGTSDAGRSARHTITAQGAS